MRSPGREVWIDGVGQLDIPPMAKSTHIKVLLVRAGASAWDDAGRLSGGADLPLSDTGREAIAALAAGIEPGSLCQVWSGPEETAVGTAKAIAQAGETKVKVVPDLREVRVGLWEGLDGATAEGRVGKAYRQWREDPTSVVPPGGESVTDAADRAVGAVGGLLAKCRGDESCGVCLVLRPMVLGIVRCWLAGEAYGSAWKAGGGEEMAEWLLVDRESVRGGLDGGPSAVRHAG